MASKSPLQNILNKILDSKEEIRQAHSQANENANDITQGEPSAAKSKHRDTQKSANSAHTERYKLMGCGDIAFNPSTCGRGR